MLLEMNTLIFQCYTFAISETGYNIFSTDFVTCNFEIIWMFLFPFFGLKRFYILYQIIDSRKECWEQREVWENKVLLENYWGEMGK